MRDPKPLRYLVPAMLIACGLAFVVIGILDKEILTVFKKAAAICTECIGIGG